MTLEFGNQNVWINNHAGWIGGRGECLATSLQHDAWSCHREVIKTTARTLVERIKKHPSFTIWKRRHLGEYRYDAGFEVFPPFLSSLVANLVFRDCFEVHEGHWNGDKTLVWFGLSLFFVVWAPPAVDDQICNMELPSPHLSFKE